MDLYESGKELAYGVSQQLVKRGSVVAEQVASAWNAHKPTTKLGWTVSFDR